MKKTWNTENIIDLNHFYECDQLLPEEEIQKLHARDRDIFLQAFQDDSDDHSNKFKHHALLALWLEERRNTLSDSPGTSSFPGKVTAEYLRIFRLLITTTGLIFGILGGLSFFVYTGSTPLNVFSFISIFILPQLFLILFFLLRFLLTKSYKRSSSNINRFVQSLFAALLKLADKHTTVDFQTTRKQIRKQMLAHIHGGLLFWPLFIASQLFGITFNIGLTITTAFKIATSDLAFGWQTTLQLGSQQIYAIVQLIAAPWSWFLPPGLSHPTLEQISGSRIILKDGIYNLLTQDLTSWWPFLLLSLLFYGLFPRLFLFLYGLFRETRATRSQTEKSHFREITNRMCSPILSSQAPLSDREDIPEGKSRESRETHRTPNDDRRDVLLLLPDDMSHTVIEQNIRDLVKNKGYLPAETRTIFQSYEADGLLLEELRKYNKPILILLESWMPPIEEQLAFLQSLQENSHANIPIGVLLLGRQESSGNFGPPRASDIEQWENSIQSRCTNMYIIK